MKFFILMAMLCVSSHIWAQPDVAVTPPAPTKNDSLRSIYIKMYPDHFFLWPLLKQRRLDFEISDLPSRSTRLIYKSNRPYSIGLGMYFFEVALEVTVAIPLDEKSVEKYGPSDARDIQVALYSKKFGLEMYRQKYEGFYIDDPAVKLPANTPYPQRPDISTRNTGLTFNYIFNNKKFSLRSSYNFAERQLKSAGSLVLFTTFADFKTSGDSAIVGYAYRDYYGVDSKIMEVKSTSFSLVPGYAYNLVYKGFFINASLAIGPAYNWLSYRTEDGNTKHDTEFRGYFVTRVAFGYSNDRFFTGISFGLQGGNIKFDNIQLTSSSGTFKILFGYRFREVGFLKKRLADLPKAFGIGR